ncbi:hypothetical protein F5148DRAFT_1380447 [Russula earlei]|uniref:Uncharacterized protein n=1 Tax=Russula earlei TaxID=71964 RepID=A0ACC0TR00_9AGAM|nr:hypothetical protein F5148DRAFT_1380447 [Russula earlei]
MGDPQLRLREIDNDISGFHNVMLSLSRSHPQRVYCVQRLAIARYERFCLSGHQDDLEQSMRYRTEAIFLPWDECPMNIVDLFVLLTLSLYLRSYESRQPEDVKWCIRCLRYLHNQPFYLPPNDIAKFLVDMLALQIKLESGDMVWNIDEMATLCHDLLESDAPKAEFIVSIEALVNAVNTWFPRSAELRPLSEKVIECLREANRCLPDLRPAVSIALAESLHDHFLHTLSNDVYEEGLAILDNIVALPTAFPAALRLVALFASKQSFLRGKPEYIEKEICRFRALLAEASLEDPLRPAILEPLDYLQRSRDYDFGVKRIEHSSLIPIPHGVPPFQDLIASISQSGSDNTSMDRRHIHALFAVPRVSDMPDIEQAVKYYRLLRTYYHPSSFNAKLASGTFHYVLREAFSRTHDIHYLDEAISINRDLLIAQVLSQGHFETAQWLSIDLKTRFDLFHYKRDFDEFMQLFPVAVNNPLARTSDRFQFACDWALFSHAFEQPCVSTAYNCAMSLMQDSLTFAPTLDTQHFQLVAMRKFYEVLPLDYASYHIHAGQLHRAIEVLERGRALLWSQMRGFRTPIDQLCVADPCLADKFVAISRDLEAAGIDRLIDQYQW